MFCPRCGKQNDDSHAHCSGCGAVLPHAAYAAPAVPPQDGLLQTLIPRNGRAVAAYYLGIFSLIPGFGFILGLLAFGIGIAGLSFAKRFPASKGQAHAWTGIILGGLVVLAHLLLFFFIINSGS